MTVFRTEAPLAWGELDLPLFGLARDWHGAPVEPPAAFSLAIDPRRLWFVATHRRPADLHPLSRPGRFQPALWKHDVAELFLAAPDGDRYLELNLGPNGAWWSCEFRAPRQRQDEAEIAMPDVATFSELAPDGSWVAALAVPLDLLRARIDFGSGTKLNVAFILENPAPRFLSAADLGGGEPDFHRPARFPQMVLAPLPER